MTWVLVTFGLLLIIGAAIALKWQFSETRWAGQAFLAHRAGHRRQMAAAPRIHCLPCHGTGWLGREPERTLTFTGDGFEDRHSPATMCPSCHGTGTAPAPR
jgi:hypothetical protein